MSLARRPVSAKRRSSADITLPLEGRVGEPTERSVVGETGLGPFRMERFFGDPTLRHNPLVPSG